MKEASAYCAIPGKKCLKPRLWGQPETPTNMASSTNTFKSREAYKAAKELEEARKAGTAPPAVDSDGKIINPHIPEYISTAPWYLQQEGPSLKHQRNHNKLKRKYDTLGKWIPRGEFAGPAATKYRKGACENCGAMTHKMKDCLERPRRRGAKLTGRGIRPDELVGNVELDFEGKRDRWNGYDENDYEEVHRRFAKLEQARKAIKAEKLDREMREGRAAGDDSDDEEREGDGAVVQQTGEAAKMSVRNLRIREDTAKYLYNLDVNSAYYDPKSRSMRADPRPDIATEDKDFAGDNFVRNSGDVAELAKMELHARRAAEVGKLMPHLQAEPSRAEAVFKEFEERKKGVKERRREEIVNKYGGSEHLRKDEGLQDVEESIAYVEYDAEGRVAKGVKESVPASKYAEDVLEKNHTRIWGSFWKDGIWGYGCCHQTTRYAFCTGADGKKAAVETEKEMKERTEEALRKRDPRSLTERWQEKEKERRENAKPDKEAASDERQKQRDVEKEIRRQEEEEKKAIEQDETGAYNRGKRDAEVMHMSEAAREAAMEAYRLRRHVKDDPMAKFMSK